MQVQAQAVVPQQSIMFGRAWLSLILSALCVAFGLIAAEGTLSMWLQRDTWWEQLQALLLSDAYSYGPTSVRALTVEMYQAALPQLSLHMTLGGLALGLGVSQFIPALRRRYRMLHRIAGVLVMSAMFASMVGALSFLSVTPLQQLTGASFQVGLWALAFIVLLGLTQALLALWARDYRNHMVWMAFTFAAILTAPVLRADWLVLGGLFSLTPAEGNSVGGFVVFAQCVLIMSVWMQRVGNRDFPAKAQLSECPAWLFQGLAIASVVVGLHEAVFAPWGWDVLAGLRDAELLLPKSALPYGLAVALAALLAPAALQRALRGETLHKGSFCMGLLVCASIFLMLPDLPQHSLTSLSIKYFWAGYALIGMILLVLARCTASVGMRRDIWAIQWLMALLFLPLVPVVFVLFLPLGLSPEETLGSAITIAISLLTALGFMLAFSATLRLGKNRGLRF